MNDDRAERVREAIRALARSEGVPIAARHVCQACATMVRAEVCLYVIGDYSAGEPICTVGTVSELIAELEATLGEGPGMQALDEERPVLVPDLSSGTSGRRWPMFTPAALNHQVAAVFAFPVATGAICVGALELHRHQRGGLSDDELADALLFADAGMELLLSGLAALDQWAEPSAGALEPFDSAVSARWRRVHQAAGMVSAQLDIDLATAYLRLRGRAYALGRRLPDVAQDVIEHRLRLPDDTIGGPDASS